MSGVLPDDLHGATVHTLGALDDLDPGDRVGRGGVGDFAEDPGVDARRPRPGDGGVDAGLQVAFGGFLVYGWLNWRQHAADEGSIRIVPLARGTLLRDLAFGLCGGVALGAAMHTFTDAALPWLDAMLTALSLVGQWWQARRHVACWWVWIAVDVVYVGAYLFKSLHVTAALYVFFLGLAVFGLRAWSAAAREPQVATR